MKDPDKLAIIILAAGASRRLGQPKQLVRYQGEPLLQRVAKECLESELGDVHVILGHKADQMQLVLEDLSGLEIAINPKWELGMGESIAFSARQILIPNNYRAAFFVLTDQIYFSKEVLSHLIELAGSTKKGIVISKYQEGKGPPSFFEKRFFLELAKLQGDSGGKSIIANHPTEVGAISFPKGHYDIDTPNDLKSIRKDNAVDREN
ncbi:MAG: nucleotidyltransferase family protein [Saprospiraceae bacterium]|nr:nucleotidyltransferase family protein [Saprospiraceae bacterium]